MGRSLIPVCPSLADRGVGPYLPTPAPIADRLCLDAKQTELGDVFLENAG